MVDQTYGNMSLDTAMSFIDPDDEKPLPRLMRQLATRVNEARIEQTAFRAWCDRADALYFANEFTRGGADLWPNDPSAVLQGRSHVSINTPPVYVDVPAALQSYPPIENMRATANTKEARTAAEHYERLYTSWKAADDFEMKFSKACTIKGLYGRTAAHYYWDKDAEDGEGRVCVEVVEQPRNLWLGYQNDSYQKPEWAAYVQMLTPNAVAEEFGVQIGTRVDPTTQKQVPFPFSPPDAMNPLLGSRSWLSYGPSMIEVWSYWYREPKYNKNGKYLKMVTMNAIFAGNEAVRKPTAYPEYDGVIPFLPLFNTFIPGVPNGRPELYDMEPIIREAYERMTSGSQMIASGTAGDFWQVVGPESPRNVPDSMQPVRNKVIGPGPGNRIESITPFIAQFQLEQYLGRLDRYGTIISGLNELLLGLAPDQVLSSSKAINALISNYEARISMRRALLYKWRANIWAGVAKVWAYKDKTGTLALVLKAGGGVLDIQDPSLAPRDDMETAGRAANLVAAKLWSQRTGMDAVGIDDPESEQDMIREESTDATLWPDRVNLMAQLMGALKALGLTPDEATQGQAQGQVDSGQEALRQSLGAATPQGGPGQQTEDTMGQTPPIPGASPNAGGAQPPFASGPAPEKPPLMQSMVQNGKLSGRILSQQELRGRGR